MFNREEVRNLKYIVISGGTGGHIFPALSISDKINKLNFKVETYLGDVKIPLKTNSKYNTFELFKTGGKNGFSVFKKIFQMGKFIMSLFLKGKGVKFSRNSIGLIFGAYFSFPWIIYFLLKKIPFVLLEQNVLPGRVNRLFERFSLVNIGGLRFRSKRWIFCGVPLREFVFFKKRDAMRYLGIDWDGWVVGVMGGSQGALNLTEFMINYAKKHRNIFFLIIVGKKNYEIFKNVNEPNVKILDFVEDMSKFYSAVDFLICRAGALTIAEASFFGKPLIMIPYPYSKDNHQYYNAFYVQRKRGGILIEEKDLNDLKIEEAINKIAMDYDIYKKGISSINSAESYRCVLKEVNYNYFKKSRLKRCFI